MKILHLAHGPFQGVPLHFVAMERRYGHQSDLVYYQGPKDTSPYPTIPLLLLDYWPIRKYRAWKLWDRTLESKRRLVQPREEDLSAPRAPLSLKPPGPLERLWYPVKDHFIRRRIPDIVREFKLGGYDVVHFDGARDLTWTADLAKALKAGGAKIVSVFFGTELRVDGVVPALDALSDLNISVETDHAFLHPNIHCLPAPFELEVPPREPRPRGPLRIVHAPSDRYLKGTDIILAVVERLKARHDFEFVLVEGVPQAECRRIKNTCDLCIDHVGNRGGTGYGISSLEMFAAGIPCVADFADYLVEAMPDHPFHLATPETLEAVLEGILRNPEALPARGEESRRWLERTHGYASIYPRMRELYAGIGLA